MSYILPLEVRASEPEGTNERASALAVWSWVLYDFSNTIFSVSILTVFFPLWVEGETGGDRKSTRLNSSHANISYAVFCLKKNGAAPLGSLQSRPISGS